MIQPEELVGDEWAEWYRLTPAQRWLESEKLWQTYLSLGGALDPEPDTQSPVFDARAAEHGVNEQEALNRGMGEKSKEFVEMGGKHYAKD